MLKVKLIFSFSFLFSYRQYSLGAFWACDDKLGTHGAHEFSEERGLDVWRLLAGKEPGRKRSSMERSAGELAHCCWALTRASGDVHMLGLKSTLNLDGSGYYRPTLGAQEDTWKNMAASGVELHPNLISYYVYFDAIP